MSPRLLLAALLLAGALDAQLTPAQKADTLASFEIVWRTVRDQHPDPKLNGLNWEAIHDATRPRIENAATLEEVRSILREMLSRLEASHYAIIPSSMYINDFAAAPSIEPVRSEPGANSPEPASSATISEPPASPATHDPEPAVPDAGTLVRFANLPESRLYFESRTLPGGAGYIRFNEFLDPASIMPRFEAALKTFSAAPGIVLDLRGNPGGIGIMAMGIAGFFIDKPGLKLGEMKTRQTTLHFVIFPRPQTYAGPLAILVDEGSASTTEILAGGLQDLKRARIFGARTAGAALPSDIVRLPDGDGFQYAQASYTSISGAVLEGNGVTPDVAVRADPDALLAGHDLVIEAANDWILSHRR